MSPDDDLEGRTRAAVAAAITASGRRDAAIAKQVGMSRAMIGNYRASKNTVTLGTAVALAQALGVTVDQLSGAEPLPGRSPELDAAVVTLRDVADVQEGLVQQLQAVASQLAHVVDQAPDVQAGTG